MKFGSPQEPDLEIDEVSAWSGSMRLVRFLRHRKRYGLKKRVRAMRSGAVRPK